MEQLPSDDLISNLYHQIGSQCASEAASLDYIGGSATAIGSTKLYDVVVKSTIEPYGNSSQVWHELALYDRRDRLEFYICRISQLGEVKYSDPDTGSIFMSLDMTKTDNRERIQSLAAQLDKTEFSSLDGQSNDNPQSSTRHHRF